MVAEMADSALLWWVKEGGMLEPFNSVMLAWKDSLTTDQVWMVIMYIQNLVE